MLPCEQIWIARLLVSLAEEFDAGLVVNKLFAFFVNVEDAYRVLSMSRQIHQMCSKLR